MSSFGALERLQWLWLGSGCTKSILSRMRLIETMYWIEPCRCRWRYYSPSKRRASTLFWRAGHQFVSLMMLLLTASAPAFTISFL